MYLESAVLGGHLVLGLSVWGTHGPRASCLGGHVRGGTGHTTTTVWATKTLIVAQFCDIMLHEPSALS